MSKEHDLAQAAAKARKPLADHPWPEEVDFVTARQFLAMTEVFLGSSGPGDNGKLSQTFAVGDVSVRYTAPTVDSLAVLVDNHQRSDRLETAARKVVNVRYSGGDWTQLSNAIGELADIVGGGTIEDQERFKREQR